ncbi:MAG: flagellin [Devosia sp.]
MELTTAATGAAATITVDNFTGSAAADLGFGTTATAAGTDAVAAVEAVEAVAAVTAGDAISVSSQAGATAALAAIDSATDMVSQARANIGALESRFSFRSDSIATTIENLSSANSAIMDTDVASESANLAAAKVKTQAAVAAAAQASQMPQDLLKLMQ